MDTTQRLINRVEGLNQQVQDINKNISSAVKEQNTSKMREILQQMNVIRDSLKEARKDRFGIVRKIKVDNTPIKQAIKTPDKPNGIEEDYSLTKMWGSQKYNPYWLKVAEYFNITEKEMPLAESKIGQILDWAANKGKTRKIGEILGIIGNTLRKIQSPGVSERAYAVLHRYISLSKERDTASPEIKKEIDKEMSAYTR